MKRINKQINGALVILIIALSLMIYQKREESNFFDIFKETLFHHSNFLKLSQLFTTSFFSYPIDETFVSSDEDNWDFDGTGYTVNTEYEKFKAVSSGVVVEKGNDYVIIKSLDDTEYCYNLKTIDVALYQYVNQGTELGTCHFDGTIFTAYVIITGEENEG